MREYRILEEIATRMGQYECPGEYTSKETRTILFRRYLALYEDCKEFYKQIDKDYPEPTAPNVKRRAER